MSDNPGAVGDAPGRDDAYRTNGFLFSDLRDYTSFVEAHGDAAAALLLDRYRELVREAVGRFGGAEIRTEGDSFYVVFPSASGAVRCGLAIVEAAAAPADGGDPIRVGIGIHAGETVETAEGYVGSAVNIAARICAEARAGEVLVSDTVRALTRTLLPFRFEARGRRRLKGIAEPITLFAVASADETPGAATLRRRRAASVSLIVLALVAGVAGLTVVLTTLAGVWSGGLPHGSPVPPLAEASPTPAAFPRTIGERRLWEQVPIVYRVQCGPSSDPLPGATASIACRLPFGEQADEVWYDRFGSRAQLGVAFQRLIDREALAEGGCTAQDPAGHGRWQVGSLWSGQRACLQQGPEAWIWWSYEEAEVVARVVRRDGAWPELIDWWETYALLLRRSP